MNTLILLAVLVCYPAPPGAPVCNPDLVRCVQSGQALICEERA